MAELREVIIGNIRLTISAGPSPSDRQIAAKGEATIYDQNVNPTRAYVGDLTTNMTSQDRQTFTDLINRLIAGIMTEYQITQENLDEGQGILNAQAQTQSTQTMMVAGPRSVSAPPPAATVVPGVVAPSMATRSYPEGGLQPPTSTAPPTPVSTPTGEGTLIPAEGANG